MIKKSNTTKKMGEMSKRNGGGESEWFKLVSQWE
jgi:hypothetical protein